MSLQKSSDKNKVEGKSYYHKRKKMEYKDNFKKFHNGNVGIKYFDNFYESNNHADLKVKIEEVDASQKEEPNWQIL